MTPEALGVVGAAGALLIGHGQTTERTLFSSRVTRDGAVVIYTVRGDGFEYEGDVFKSLSAVAKKITGSHCNGYLFFRLNRQGGAR